MREYTLDDFDYELPPDLIAQQPLPQRSASRLLHVQPDRLTDLSIADLPSLVEPGEVLVFNDTQVIKARLLGEKESGGRIEALIERVLGPQRALALLRASHAPRPGARLRFARGSNAASATVVARHEDLFELAFDRPLLPLLEQIGHVPLPPYIKHEDDADDAQRYQTVYARTPGAVAAPTAGLHFDAPLLERLRARGAELVFLTLHVGAGTFQPVRVRDPSAHTMHAEWYRIDPAAADAINAARAAGRRITAIGTTSVRALETAARDGRVQAAEGNTRLFIRPGFRFQVVDRMVTNFHLPRSTLLMLVAAFAGLERIRNAYAHAIAQRYRFYSYGDAMLLERAT
ncbi:MAG: tRNA preQ1(34) S-adenosylmethionine ribosyltransferase-isomerase QueA [Burkholderiaceae bacterium]|nr:tRNA preQ1(34) S-adenosylmethionine ribosyltransferase-isomerase QueA [Burkholderiaceae bacterium]